MWSTRYKIVSKCKFLRHTFLCFSLIVIAECGGLLGLFMGISFMSIIEIIIKAAEKIIAKNDKEDMTEKEMFSARPEQFERFV